MGKRRKKFKLESAVALACSLPIDELRQSRCRPIPLLLLRSLQRNGTIFNQCWCSLRASSHLDRRCCNMRPSVLSAALSTTVVTTTADAAQVLSSLIPQFRRPFLVPTAPGDSLTAIPIQTSRHADTDQELTCLEMPALAIPSYAHAFPIRPPPVCKHPKRRNGASTMAKHLQPAKSHG